MGSRKAVTATVFEAELDAMLDTALGPCSPRYPLSRITDKLSEDAICELATESIGNTAQTVQALIEGVIQQHYDTLDRAALAALNAVAYYHVPKLQGRVNDLGGGASAH